MTNKGYKIFFDVSESRFKKLHVPKIETPTSSLQISLKLRTRPILQFLTRLLPEYCTPLGPITTVLQTIFSSFPLIYR